MKKRRLIVVDWEDPYGNTKWHMEKDICDIEPLICHTVGWRMPAPSGYLSLASSRDNFGKCADRTVIPRSSIKAIKVIG